MDTKSYCILPYNHLSIDPTGQIRPCCNYNFHADNYPGVEKGWEFKNIIDCEGGLLDAVPHRELRKDIEAGKKHDFCNRCWIVEDGGGFSYRQSWNQWFDAAEPHQFRTNINIEYLELTLGNKCNIQCRMCNPWSSSMWADDMVNNPEINFWKADMSEINFEWYDHPNFDKVFEEIIPTLKHLNMLGGEPLFVPKYYELLQRIIDSGRAPEVSLQFNTNMLAVQDKVFDLWKHFKKININMSCDGVNGVNEYVRWPGKWSKWERNLQKVINWSKQMEPGKWILQVHSTMSSLTWLDLANLYEYTQTLDIEIKLPYLIQVNQPAYMDAIHLPDAIKQKGYDSAVAVLNNSNAPEWEKANNQALLDHVMNQNRDPVKWEQFIEHTNKLDKVRKQTILDVIPEYRDYWKT